MLIFKALAIFSKISTTAILSKNKEFVNKKSAFAKAMADNGGEY